MANSAVLTASPTTGQPIGTQTGGPDRTRATTSG
jgi:hypothetical protein